MWLLWCLKHQPSEDSSNPSNPQSVTDGALHTYSWSASVVLNSLTSKWIHLLQEHAGDESSLGWTVQTEVTAEGSGIQVHRFPAYHQWPKLFGGFKKKCPLHLMFLRLGVWRSPRVKVVSSWMQVYFSAASRRWERISNTNYTAVALLQWGQCKCTPPCLP